MPRLRFSGKSIVKKREKAMWYKNMKNDNIFIPTSLISNFEEFKIDDRIPAHEFDVPEWFYQKNPLLFNYRISE